MRVWITTLVVLVPFILMSGCQDQTLEIDDYAEEASVVRASGSDLAVNPDRSVFFGDLHVHTSNSFDAYLLGNTVSPSDGYRYAKGCLLYTSDAADE